MLRRVTSPMVIWIALAACGSEIDSSIEAGPAHTVDIMPVEHYRLPAQWSVRVRAESGDAVELEIAIGYDQTLRMIKSNTPFEFEFVANHYTALMSLTDPNERIEAEVWSDVDGQFQMKGSISGGQLGKFTFDPSGPTFGSAGSRF